MSGDPNAIAQFKSIDANSTRLDKLQRPIRVFTCGLEMTAVAQRHVPDSPEWPGTLFGGQQTVVACALRRRPPSAPTGIASNSAADVVVMTAWKWIGRNLPSAPLAEFSVSEIGLQKPLLQLVYVRVDHRPIWSRCVTPLFPSGPANCRRCVPNWQFSPDSTWRFLLSLADKEHALIMQLKIVWSPAKDAPTQVESERNGSRCRFFPCGRRTRGSCTIHYPVGRSAAGLPAKCRPHGEIASVHRHRFSISG
jgi:hypothetical protein